MNRTLRSMSGAADLPRSSGKKRGIRTRGLEGLVFGLALVALLPVQAEGQRGRAQVEEGNRLYSEGRFDEAHQKYLEALLDDPASPLIRFNDGSALYQSQNFQRAMERFLEAAESGDPSLQSAAWYNLGNALYRQQQLQESLEAYKQALRVDPSDIDAKHNLERVLEQMQEQEQDQQGKGEDQENQDREQDRKQQGEGENRDQQQGQDRQDASESQDRQPQDSPRPQGENQQEEDPSQGEQPQDLEPQEGGESQPQSGQMSPDEAERLLNAIREDPGDVNRKRVAATGRRPRKNW